MEELSFKNVSIYYQNKKTEICAVNDFSFTFKKKKKYAIIGYSGSGKTTLVRTITGSLVFDGEITLDGINIEKIPVNKRSIAYVGQPFYLYPHLTIYDNLIFPLRSVNTDHIVADSLVKDMANSLSLSYLLTRKPKVISLGQASRVAIGRSLIKKSDIIIMDEALSNLDKDTSATTLSFIKNKVNEFNATLIYITHDIKEALFIADYILFMKEGQLYKVFSPKELLTLNDEVIAEFLKDLKNETK